MILRRLLLAGATASAGLLGTVALAAPAGAVQTDTLSLYAAPLPNGQARPALSGRGAQASTDTLVVGDRGSAPITVELAVISARQEGKTFGIGGPISGLAKLVTLPEHRLVLQPGQAVRVPVHIGSSGGPTTFAAITAETQSSVSTGSLNVAERLALLVESQGGPQVASGPSHSGLGGGWPAVAGGALALVAAGIVVEQVRGRRQHRSPERVATAAVS